MPVHTKADALARLEEVSDEKEVIVLAAVSTLCEFNGWIDQGEFLYE